MRASGADVLVLPDSVIARADASARFNRGCFHHHQASATGRAAAEVHQMPVRREPIHAGILAHRRNEDPIPEGNFADGQRSK
jgi:hypothetical protein